MSNSFVFRFVPSLYSENITIKELNKSQNAEIEMLNTGANNAFKNNFIITSDIVGIRRYEAILNIIADELKDTLEFRRNRLYSKHAMIAPFTRIFLEQQLETIFGNGKWILDIDSDNYAIYIDIETSIPSLYEQTIADIAEIIPANLTVIAVSIVPYTHEYLNRNYTYEQMEQLDYEELSKYS